MKKEEKDIRRKCSRQRGEIDKKKIDLENIKNIDKKYFWHYAQIHANNYKNKVYLVVIFGLNVNN